MDAEHPCRDRLLLQATVYLHALMYARSSGCVEPLYAISGFNGSGFCQSQ